MKNNLNWEDQYIHPREQAIHGHQQILTARQGNLSYSIVVTKTGRVSLLIVEDDDPTDLIPGEVKLTADFDTLDEAKETAETFEL